MSSSQSTGEPVPADSAPDGPQPGVVDRIEARWPTSTRQRIAAVAAITAIVVATAIASSRLLLVIVDSLDIFAYAGLFVACWIGAGGAIVPVPGVRAFSWFMIVQQGAVLDPVVVALVGASAMVLGQTSYFLAARTAARRMERPEAAASAAEDVPDADEEPTSRRARYLASAKSRVERQIQDHGMATVYLVCALPSPVTTLATTAAASAGMSYVRFFPASFGGYLTLCAVLALVGQGIITAIRSLNLF